jgi:hypothetical protein
MPQLVEACSALELAQLEPVLHRAMDKNPSHRFQSGKEFLAAVTAAVGSLQA